MTKEQLLALGRDARRILSDPAFEKMVSITRKSLSQTFFNSDPADTKARELAYNTNLALDHLLGVLAQTETVAAQIEANDSDNQEDYR